MKNKKIIEINGVKLEVDLSTARRISEYKVGDNVKVLIKGYSNYTSYVGVITGFDDFMNKPAINIAYIDSSYSTADIKFLNFYEGCEAEICPTNDLDLNFNKETVISYLESNIRSAELKLQQEKMKLEYFEKNFSKYFEEAEKED
jgi:small nuclear ribonucleoprotein (snRNP)-like protein